MGEECGLWTGRGSGRQLRYIVTHSPKPSYSRTCNNILIPAITGAIKTHWSPFHGTIVCNLCVKTPIKTRLLLLIEKRGITNIPREWWPSTLIQKIPENTATLLTQQDINLAETQCISLNKYSVCLTTGAVDDWNSFLHYTSNI